MIIFANDLILREDLTYRHHVVIYIARIETKRKYYSVQADLTSSGQSMKEGQAATRNCANRNRINAVAIRYIHVRLYEGLLSLFESHMAR